MKRAGLEGHTFAWGKSLVASTRRVRSLLGYSSTTQTMGTYSDLIYYLGGDAVDGPDKTFS